MSLSLYTLEHVLSHLTNSRLSITGVLETLDLEHLRSNEELLEYIDERLFECSCCGVWKDYHYLNTTTGECLECYPDE